MKTKNIFLLSCGLLLSLWTKAQEVQAELNTTPPAQTEVPAKEMATEPAKPGLLTTPRKIQYGLSAGSMFTNGFGSATFFQPSVMVPVSKRFSAFGSLNVITNYGGAFNRTAFDSQFPGATGFARSQYILSAGGNYLVNERLNLTGSVWRDLSNKNFIPNTPFNVFGARGTSGMQFRANYKITENLSVSGGFRYSNGNSFNTLYQQNLDPFGF